MTISFLILQYRMLLTPESEGHIERVLLHECRVPQFTGLTEDNVLEKYVDLQGWKCYGKEYPSDLKRFCSHSTVAILGRGYDGFKFPDNVGIEIGDTIASTYYRLEIQFENQEGLYSKWPILRLRRLQSLSVCQKLLQQLQKYNQ